MPCQWQGYRLWQQFHIYGGVEQRWILVESQQRAEQDRGWKASFEKQEKALQRQLRQLCTQVFACKPDAMEALLRFQQTLQWHTLVQARLQPVVAKRSAGRPKRSAAQETQGYQ